MILKEGEYSLPQGTTIIRNCSSVIVRPTKCRFRKPGDFRCVDCKNRVIGKWMKRQWYDAYVCVKQPKRNEGLYYAVKDLGGKNCSLFEKKDE